MWGLYVICITTEPHERLGVMTALDLALGSSKHQAGILSSLSLCAAKFEDADPVGPRQVAGQAARQAAHLRVA